MRFTKQGAQDYFDGLEQGQWTTEGFFQAYKTGDVHQGALSPAAQELSDQYRTEYARRRRLEERLGTEAAIARSHRIQKQRR